MIFYTYMYLREDGTPYYIGKGARNRAFRPHRTGVPPKDRILIEPHTSEADALESEKFLIAYYGREDLRTGCLLNLTNGGEEPPVGRATGKRSAESKQRMRLAKLGKKFSPDHVEKLRKSHQEHPLPQEALAARGRNISVAKKGVPFTEEHKEAIRQSRIGKTLSAPRKDKGQKRGAQKNPHRRKVNAFDE